MDIAVLVSGHGSNLQALMEAGKEGRLGKGRIKAVISDRADAFALQRVRGTSIHAIVHEKEMSVNGCAYDEALLGILRREGVELVLLAGFMRILTEKVVDAYRGRILNIHPSLLPAFRGGNAIKKAYDHGVKVTGVTVHLVDEGVDTGPILAQRPVEVPEGGSLEELEDAVHRVEHELYPQVVRKFTEGRYGLSGRRTFLK